MIPRFNHQPANPLFRRGFSILLLSSLVIMLTLPSTVSQATTGKDACSSSAGSTADSTAKIATGMTEQTITSGGLKRSYQLYVPTIYQPTQATPLVFSLHGFASYPAQQQSYARWEVVAEQDPMIVVYPAGTGFPLRWNSGNSPFVRSSARAADDVQFFRDLITELSSTLCIDPARIYVNGLSNGAGMSNRLACELSDVVAAMGGVAGAYSPVDCAPTRPVPIIAFHGTADRIVNYAGDANLSLPSANDWVAGWATRNGCNPTPTKLPAKGDASGIQYNECKADAAVIFYTVAKGGHTWPGGPEVRILGKTSKDIDATATMWAFFKQHSLP